MVNKIGKILAGLILSCTFTAAAEARPLTIVYVPLDNRPVCLDYVQQTAEAAGCRLLIPPFKQLPDHFKNSNPDKLLTWLEEKLPDADAAVFSTDTLIYGGLVASRTHNYNKEQLLNRVRRIGDLAENKETRLYAFSTIMRTPYISYGGVEPPYYDKWGPDIYHYSQLRDKKEQITLPPGERLTMAKLWDKIPSKYLYDWYNRRALNMEVNEQLTRLLRMNKFHYLAIGKDDNAPYSATHQDSKHLSMSTWDLDDNHFHIIDGVDQLGLLLINRAFNETNNIKPSIYPLYAPGKGQATLPKYSDSRLQDSVPVQIKAAGATIAKDAYSADLILALNTPYNGTVQEGTADDNKFFANPWNKQFITTINKHLNQGRKISLADVSYANGADNGFMHILARTPALEKLEAYNGWNTADNSIGYAITQGLLAKYMTSANKHKLLQQRLVDDWFYQSNARARLTKSLERRGRYVIPNNKKEDRLIVAETMGYCQEVAKNYSYTKNIDYKLTFPWKRMFEVNVSVKN